ncbi:hypothetical protein, partial [Prevotella denticola]
IIAYYRLSLSPSVITSPSISHLIIAYHSISPPITPFPLSASIPPKRKKESPGDKSPGLSRV